MIFLLSLIGIVLIVPAAGALYWDIAVLIQTGQFKLSTWGELWYALHPSSLNLYQAVVERYLSIDLWDEVLAPMLFWPAVLAFGLPGLILAFLPKIQRVLTRDAYFDQN